MCPLCKNDEQTNAHLLNSYAYAKEVCAYLRLHYKVKNLWVEDPFVNNFNMFFLDIFLKSRNDFLLVISTFLVGGYFVGHRQVLRSFLECLV